MVSELVLRLVIVIAVAIVGGIGAFAAWFLLMLALKRISVSLESQPLKIVRRFFRQQYPNESIAWLRLSAAQPERWVVGVFFGSARPPRYKFFAVNRRSEEIVELVDCRQHAPKQWR